MLDKIKSVWGKTKGFAIMAALALVIAAPAIVAPVHGVHAQSATVTTDAPTYDFNTAAGTTASMGNQMFNMATNTVLPYVYTGLKIAFGLLALFVVVKLAKWLLGKIRAPKK